MMHVFFFFRSSPPDKFQHAAKTFGCGRLYGDLCGKRVQEALALLRFGVHMSFES